MLTHNRIWVVWSVVILLTAAIASIVWLYIVRIYPPIYWLVVWSPYIFCMIGVLAFLLLVFVLASPDPKPKLAVIALLGTLLLAGWEAWIAWAWIAPIHQMSLADSDHVYHLAIDPLLDVGNPYDIFECDKLGIICRKTYGGIYSHDHSIGTDTQLKLAFDTASSTLQVIDNAGQVVGSHVIP